MIRQFSLEDVRNFVGLELFFKITLKASQINSTETLLKQAQEEGETSKAETWTKELQDVTIEYGNALLPFRQKLSDNGMTHEEIEDILTRINKKPKQKTENENDFNRFL
jgi:hypothetical protein